MGRGGCRFDEILAGNEHELLRTGVIIEMKTKAPITSRNNERV